MKIKLLFLLFSSLHLFTAPLRVMHISCHKGCIEEFERIAHELKLKVTSWHVLTPDIFRRFSHDSKPNFNIMNMTHEKAADIWQRNKDIFNSFDVIITSDTAPFSRIFLQNDWQKPLIIWVCNRFDYHHQSTAQGFPDQEYYDLIGNAHKRKNVFIASYTPFEYKYAKNKNINLGDLVIKPIGSMPKKISHSSFPLDVNKSEIIFLTQTGPSPLYKLERKKLEYVSHEFAKRGIKGMFGQYNGADDLTGVKGVVHFPYQASNLFLFENIQRGIIHFVPSEKFLAMARESNEPNMPCKSTKYWLDSFQDSEWYLQENKKLFVYFDSWDDLKQKIDTLDYQAKRTEVLKIAQNHREMMLIRWRSLFNLCRLQLK